MQLEIQVALNFLISYLYNKLPRRRVNTFGEELQRQLEAKYQGHWYPDRPSKGSGYRCLQVGVKVDPVVECAARQSGLDLADVRHNLPQDLSVWIDPYEVSYQIGDKGTVKVLYVDDSGPEGGGAAGADLDKEIRNSFNPEAQVFLPISEPPAGGGVTGVGGGGSPASISPSPPFGHSEAGSPSFLPRSAQPLTFTTATFAATKFGSTKMKSSGRGNNNNNNAGGNHSNNMGNNNSSSGAGKQAARSSPSGLKPGAAPHSILSLYGPPHLKPSALSPNAKEFVFPSLQGPGSPGGPLFPGEGPLGPLGYGHALDVLAAYGGLGDAALMDGLGLGALQYSHQQYSHQQYSHQQYQPVMAN